METIRDCLGRIACKGDPKTGLVECLYKGNKTSTILAVGEAFTVEREDTITEVIFTRNKKFQVNYH